MKRIFCVLLAAFVGAMGPDTAAETLEQSEPTPISDSIVVTANRVGMAAAETVWPVKIVTTSNLPADEGLDRVLDGIAGLDIRSHGGVGSLSTVSNWGLFARHLLLVYNGRVVKDYSLGGFNLSDFSVSEIERVEILKGPQSAFYGADAVGGVINLITPTSLANRVDVTVNRGAHDFQQYGVGLSRRFGQFGLAGHGEFTSSDNHRGNAGSERSSLNIRSDYLSDDGRHHLLIGARYFSDSLGVPGPQPGEDYIPVYGDSESWSLYDHQKDENYSLDLQYRYTGKDKSEFQADLFWEKKNLQYNSLYNYRFSYYLHDFSSDPPDSSLAVDSVDVLGHAVYGKRSAGISTRYLRELGRVQVAGGVDYLTGSVKAATLDQSSGTNVTGPFAPYEYSYDTYNYWRAGQDQVDLWANSILKTGEWYRIDLSGRLQFVEGRRTQPSYNLGVVLSECDCWQVKFGYGYAFRLPTIAEQFAEDVFTPGNAELKPETSRSLAATLDVNLAEYGLTTHFTLFHQKVDSLIRYLLDWNTFLYVPRNVDRFRTTGVDVSVEKRFASEAVLSVSGVIQNAKQTSPDGGDYVDAFYVPDFKWRAGLSGEFSRVTYGLNLSFTSDRSILMSGQPKIIDRVYELGASLSFAITSQFTASIQGYDLTDRRRPDQFGFSLDDRDYPTPGRRVVVGLRYRLL